MQSYLRAGEEHLTHMMRHVYNTPVGWWVIIYQPQGSAAPAIAEHTNQLELAANVIDNAVDGTGQINFYVCTNSTFVLLGKGTRSKKLIELEDQFKAFFQNSADEDLPPEERLTFEITFYDLSVQLTAFVKHLTLILAECEKIKEDKRSQIGVLRQNFFPLIDEEKKQTLQDRRLYRKNLHVMFIEDDRATLSLLRQLMVGIDNTYQVTTVENGEKGINTYFEEAPDILFLDVNLPDISGLEILEFINHNDRQCYIIMLTAEASEGVVRKALTHGAKGFVRKPFTKKQFQTALEKFQKRRA